jgi:hypothetical protein
MGWFAKAFGFVLGAVEIAVGLLVPGAQFLMTMGVGQLINAVGTLMSKGPMAGTQSAVRNSIASENVCYGQSRLGGTTVYLQ